MTHTAEKDARCEEHGDVLIWEPGGPDMPTLYGRRYCPTCQTLLMEALDSLPATHVLPPEVRD